MNILVTGANGQLGTCLRLASASSAHHYTFTDVNELDITSPQAVKEALKGQDVLVNCAAYTNVDRAEQQQELATKLNAQAVGILARSAQETGTFFIHISTDYVFGGNKGNTPRDENEPTNPTGVYGQTKLEGEREFAQAKCHGMIIRTAWLYSEYGKNFVKTMIDLTSSRHELNVVFDQAGTPTYAQDLADAIAKIIEDGSFKGQDGIYHYTNEGVCSWYDFAQIIARYAGNDSCQISPCHSNEFPSAVKRPAFSVLDKTKFKNTFHISIPFWVDSLKQCVENLKANKK